MSALQRHAAVLWDPAAPVGRRRESLKFLAHFVGDLHQPLHVGNREDRGGNDIDVVVVRWWFLPVERTNLHRVWDTTLVERTGSSWKRRAGQLLRRTDAEDAEAWQGGWFVDWANDTRGVFMRSGLAETASGTRITGAYIEGHREVVNEQLTKAGLRLAACLNALFRR